MTLFPIRTDGDGDLVLIFFNRNRRGAERRNDRWKKISRFFRNNFTSRVQRHSQITITASRRYYRTSVAQYLITLHRVQWPPISLPPTLTSELCYITRMKIINHEKWFQLLCFENDKSIYYTVQRRRRTGDISNVLFWL